MRILFVLLTVIFCTANIYAQECKVLRVSGSIGWNPLVMKNEETKKITGIAYDLSHEIGKKLNIPIKFIELPWKRMLLYLKKGKIDMVLGIYWTQQRSQNYYYTSPFLNNDARVFVF